MRFFTRREIEKLFYRAAFRVNEIKPAPCGTARSPFPTDAAAQSPLPKEADESTHERYQITATAEARPEYGLTSIVIVTHNQLACTHACLAGIRFVTDEPYELIVVDNGSTDGTVEYLRSCSDIKLIANADNRGFPAAANQGIQASAGAQVLLLNNDVLVTTGWLRRMLEAMEGTGDRAQVTDEESEDRSQKSEECSRFRHESSTGTSVEYALHGIPPESAHGVSGLRSPLAPQAEGGPNSHESGYSSSRIGLVGPLTNSASGYQEIRVTYHDTSCLDGFAWEHAGQHAGELHEVDRLIGFCLLIKREVIDEIGLLDERFGIGNYEDDDFCRRARNAGWRLVVAREAFIHHVGHRTFAGAGVDLNALLIRNRQIYDEKWAEQGIGNRAQGTEKVAQYDNAIAPPCCPLSPVTCNLSLCMIVRNNANTIRPYLESIRPWVDEMIVVDTGSTDATPDICRELGAEVYHMTWPDSFSIARNESLKYAQGRWIFWMDSDDVIDPENGRKLRGLVYSLPFAQGEGGDEGALLPLPPHPQASTPGPG